MRSVIPKKKEERTKQLALGAVLVAVMFISVLGYSFQGDKKSAAGKVEHNGFEFIEGDGFWFTNIGNYQFVFKYNPKEVDRIDSPVKLLNYYYGKPLYISSDSEEASLEIYRNLFYNNRIAERIQSACLNEEGCEENLPVKGCSDNFVIIKEDIESKITQNESCVFIEGPKENLTRLTDEYLFKILDVR